MSENAQIPPVANQSTTAPSKKKKLGCLAWLSVIFIGFVILVAIGAFLGDESQVPKTIETKSDSIIWRDWIAVHDFNKRLSDFTKAIALSSASQFANRFQNEMEALKVEFKAEGKILNVPVGTTIKITKYCDENGNEVEPVWKERARAFFTPVVGIAKQEEFCS